MLQYQLLSITLVIAHNPIKNKLKNRWHFAQEANLSFH